MYLNKQSKISLGIIFGALVIGALIIAIPRASTVTGDLRTLAPSEFKAAIQSQDVRLIDVRTLEEFAGGHIAGASNIDFYGPDFRSEIAALDRSASYAIYCHSGNRSGQTLAIMKQLGFTNVVELQGGIAAWEASGYPETTN